MTAEVTAWRNDLAMSADQLAYFALRTLFSETVAPAPIVPMGRAQSQPSFAIAIRGRMICCSAVAPRIRGGNLVPDDPRITLIFDPFNICDSGETRVCSFVAEKQAFREIEQLLLRDLRFDTVQPKTFVIDNLCWQHFRTYHGVQGVRIEEVTPRTRLRDWIGADPPDWLSNHDIRRWGLLERERPTGLAAGGWAATIATWLAPA